MNLLPSTEKEALRKGFKFRSLILTSFVITVTFLAGLVMLLPSYFMALGNISELTLKNPSLGLAEDKSAEEFLKLPEEIDAKMSLLQSNNRSQPAVGLLSQIVKLLPDGVRVNSISLTRSQEREGKNVMVATIAGVALDRDSLVALSQSLEESDSFLAVDIPVSSLTKDRNLPFSIDIFVENK